MNTPVWIGLGSNLGDRQGILDAAIAALTHAPGVIVRSVSSSHETRPVGGPPGQGPFLNAAAHLETTLGPHQLLVVLQEIENQAGRVRTVRWGERTLDLDILIYGTKFLNTKELKLPHRRLAFRRFVLAPLAEIAPRIVDTMTMWTIADLLANLDRKPRLLSLLGTSGPIKSTIFEQLIERLPAFGIEGVQHEPHHGNAVAFRESVVKKAEALSIDRWSGDAGGNTWGISNFLFDPRSIDFALDRLPQSIRDDQLLKCKAGLVKPIFSVNLAGGGEMYRGPKMKSVPQLWPESDQPEAIIAEVLATCRAIEGV